jgi:hypothetical protein
LIRRPLLILPCLATALFALVQQGCSEDADPAPHGSGDITSKPRSSSGEEALRHDLAWTAAAAARCSQQGAGPDCASKAKGDIGALSFGVKARALDGVLGQLPTKEAICAIVKALTAAANGSPDAGADDAGADASSADVGQDGPDLLDVWGGRAAREGGGTTTADTAVVWDLSRSQSAVFIHADGGVGALTSFASGYRGPGKGQAANVIATFSGMFELDAVHGAGHIRKPDGSTTIALGSAALPGGVPPVSPAFLATSSRTSYVPWDSGTAALAGLPTGQVPKVAGGAGAQYVQYTADPESETTAGAQMALAMLNQAGDQGDFKSPAGNGALTAIASGIAQGLGLSLDGFCGGGADGGAADGGTSCTGEAEGYCGESTCGWNGNGFCCRPEPTGNEACQIDDECIALHGPTSFCGLKSKPVPEGETQSVCTYRAACSK